MNTSSNPTTGTRRQFLTQLALLAFPTSARAGQILNKETAGTILLRESGIALYNKAAMPMLAGATTIVALPIVERCPRASEHATWGNNLQKLLQSELGKKLFPNTTVVGFFLCSVTEIPDLKNSTEGVMPTFSYPVIGGKSETINPAAGYYALAAAGFKKGTQYFQLDKNGKLIPQGPAVSGVPIILGLDPDKKLSATKEPKFIVDSPEANIKFLTELYAKANGVSIEEAAKIINTPENLQKFTNFIKTKMEPGCLFQSGKHDTKH